VTPQPFLFSTFLKQVPAVPNDNSYSSELVQKSICICAHKYDRKHIAVTYPIVRHTSHDLTYKMIPLIKYLHPASYKTHSTTNSNFVLFICSLQFIRFLSSQTIPQASPAYTTSTVKKTQQISAVSSIRAIYMDPNLWYGKTNKFIYLHLFKQKRFWNLHLRRRREHYNLSERNCM